MAYGLGETVKLRVGRGSTVRVLAPDQSVATVDAPHGHFSLWLAQPGVWAYEWDGDGGGSATIEVGRQQVDVVDEQAQSRVLSGRFSTGSP